MGKSKSHSMNIFQILFYGFITYIKNFIPLTRVMIFPVFGQLLGVLAILFPSYMLTKNATTFLPIDILAAKIMLFYLLLIIIVMPGFFIFAKAFWEYMVAMVSLNSMISVIQKQGRLKGTEIKIQTQAIKLRASSYITLLLIITLMWFIALAFPALMFIGGINPNTKLIFAGLEVGSIFILTIVSIYLSLCFQVFAFENTSTFNVLKRSWNLIEGNFWKAFALAVILFILTNFVIPPIFQILYEKSSLLAHTIPPVKMYVADLIGDLTVLSQFGPQLSSLAICSNPSEVMFCIYNISRLLILSVVGIIVTSILLPFGSACYTLLYQDIASRKSKK